MPRKGLPASRILRACLVSSCPRSDSQSDHGAEYDRMIERDFPRTSIAATPMPDAAEQY